MWQSSELSAHSSASVQTWNINILSDLTHPVQQSPVFVYDIHFLIVVSRALSKDDLAPLTSFPPCVKMRKLTVRK